MNSCKNIRTRFAPSPSGIMHIGNMRSALMSYLCAKEKSGSFILRIEDTDQSRTQDLYLSAIYNILDIMKLFPDESPLIGGTFGSYIQSERSHIYQNYLNIFLEKKLIYRCFKTTFELEEERKKQIALKLPPRYERIMLSEKLENEYILMNKPFIWRLKIDSEVITVIDKVKGKIQFDMNNFADCPITRQDGTFTFLFANFVDDVEMKISYVIRGEEHLSNTAIQAYMYHILAIPQPDFYHLPLICDEFGKKLSKRNFGFNIFDLLESGFLPEAIINYIAIIGSGIKEEILSLREMIEMKLFSHIKSSGLITYDMNKLIWINSKWMQKIEVVDFIPSLQRFKEKSSQYKDIEIPSDVNLIIAIKKESRTIEEFFENIALMQNHIDSIIFEKIEKEEVDAVVKMLKIYIQNLNISIGIHIKNLLATNQISNKKIYHIIRKILINKIEGISIVVLLQYISREKINEHCNKIVYQ